MTAQLESPRPDSESTAGLIGRHKQTFGFDLGASLVVFLVALPLCVGIAVASGVPAELGIITGVVGGIVVGCLPGSTMQVSGPAAGLTVLVSSAVADHGLATLGVIVLGAGLLQILLGLIGIGTWFRAISPSVVQGMLAGIGLVIILGQIYPVGGMEQPSETGAKFSGLPELLNSLLTTSTGRSGLAIAVVTLLTMTLWGRMPQRLRLIPGPLVGVGVAALLTSVLGLPLETIQVGSLLETVNLVTPDSFGAATSFAVLGSILTFALIASAESLFSAAAIDRMHDGPKTRFNTELMAQGVGNTICGVLGALPMTAVIVRSTANLNAGARTKLSRVMHGIWLLLFVMLLPGVLSYIPLATLGALLLHAGWKLLGVRQVAKLLREQRAEAFVLVLTAGMILGTDLLIGTLTGLVAAVIKTAWEVSRLSVEVEHEDEEDHAQVRLHGNATFLRLPQLQDKLEQLPVTSSAHVDMTPVRHLDLACHQAVENWAEQRRKSDCEVELAMPSSR
ncbi:MULTISPECIES: SulP family inorganic anion transporter [unclassified Actinopolyspora]|uniref:SulP family inorganic anion transporter n=1 Tax=Actinopolyspora TaxID=1849 RepID=UPI0013F62A43|nr:SulP family inorganic anion transporter [Actinopolyspora sp. BKK2]NHE76745.1 SulP family inorganic anion transporter [Actinopolyspora sp. BKK1]